MTHETTLPLAHERVTHHARERPAAVALEDGTLRLTYAELDMAAAGFARTLDERGIQAGDIVAVEATRSPATLVAMLGIWRCGATYLPLDPALPEERRRAILADARPLALVGGTAVEGEKIAAPTFAASAPPTPFPPHARADTPAYVLYTSGSTGEPKGVLVDHAALAHRADVQLRQFDLRPGERVTQYTSLAWDASLFEILLAWGAGATLHLLPEAARRSGTALIRHLRDVRAEACFLPPAVLATLPPEPLPSLRLLMVGGDSFSAALVERWAPGRRFVNLYGPTEATVWMTTEECRPHAPVTLGHPIPDVRVLVADAEGQPLPAGEIGELCIAGAGLARGYLKRPELTAARFVPAPDEAGTRMYRTGDRGRILPDGRVEMHGRLDDQVKIRGMRMELGEVEAAISALPDVIAAAVATDADARGDKRLVAYVTTADTPRDAVRLADEPLRRRIREGLLVRLPEGMVPSILIEMGALPRTPNDKVDRRALPPPARLHVRNVPVVEAPRNELERLVAQAWTEELGLPVVGLHENVFELGAHSLLATHVQARLERALDRPIDIVLLFEAPTIAALAAKLAETGEPQAAPAAVIGAPSDAAARGAARRAALTHRRGAARTSAPPSSEVDTDDE